MKRRIVIVGNGIAGITAARHLRKLGDDRITVISAESDHFFSRTALMYIYMGHLSYAGTKPYEDSFWKKNRIELRRAWVEAVDTDKRCVNFAGGDSLPYDVLILATGSQSNKFGWPGQDLQGVQGLYSLQDLELMERNTAGIERAVIVGGGLIGIETAEMCRSRGIPVTMLVRESRWMQQGFPAEESAMIEAQIRRHGVELRLETELDRILGDDSGRVCGVVTSGGDQIDAGFVALTVGVRPNIDWLGDSPIDTDRGILVDETLRTNVDDVYAIGDCAQLRNPAPGRRPIEAVWYTGRIMGQTVARTIRGRSTPYRQEIWYNSAKFFDLEWQIYGQVPPTPDEGTDDLFWQDEAGERSIRIRFRQADGAVVGFNVMGIRYRHEVCDDWLRRETPLREVLPELGRANFDPELFEQYEAAIVDIYNRRHPDSPLRLRRKRGLGARRVS